MENNMNREESLRKGASLRKSHWIEEGKKYIYPQRSELWEQCIDVSLHNIYNGMELNYALEIIDALDKKASFEEVFQKAHREFGDSAIFGYVMNIVVIFSKVGPEFYIQNNKNLSQKDIEVLNKTKEENLRFEEELKNQAFNQKNASNDIVQGQDLNNTNKKERTKPLTREEMRQQVIKDMEEKRELAEQKKGYWIEEGKKYIYPQNESQWKRCVDVRVDDVYVGVDIDCALQIMDALDNGKTFEEVNQLVEEQNHSGSSLRSVMGIVSNFSKVGPEFCANFYNIDIEDSKGLKEKKEFNEKCERELQEKNALQNQQANEATK